MGHQLRAQGPHDQLERFDQLEKWLNLSKLEIGWDMICYVLIGPSLGGQESSLYKGEVMYQGGNEWRTKTIQIKKKEERTNNPIPPNTLVSLQADFSYL